MKKLMLLSLFVLTACGSKNNDPTTPPPPTVPGRQPLPAPKTANTTSGPAKPADTKTGQGAVAAPPAPAAPAPVLPVVPATGTSLKVLNNVVLDCRNSVTGKAVQVNGYMTDIGERYFLRPNGQGPIEIESGNALVNSYLSSRFCAKAGPAIPDLSVWALEVKGHLSDLRKGKIAQAVLTRYRNLSSIQCDQLGKLEDYDLREAYNCSMGPSAFVNPDDTSTPPVELANLGKASYDGGQTIRNVKRDALGNVMALINKATLIRLDKKLNLDTAFGDNGKMNVEMPREILGGDQMSKILDFASDNVGGVVIVGSMQRTGDLVAVHLSAKGDLLRNLFVNGYTILKPSAASEYRGYENETSLVVDGQSVFVFYRENILLARNGSVVNLYDRLTSPIRAVNMSAAAGGGVFITWWDQSRTVLVTKFNSDGSANSPISPTPNMKMDTYYYGLEGTVSHPDGGFYLIYKTIERDGYGYGSEVIKFDRVAANGIRNPSDSYSKVNSSSGYDDSVNYKLLVKNTIVFANGLLGVPVRWGARISDTKQGGVIIADPTKKSSGKSYHSSVGLQDMGFDGDSNPWIVVKDDGSIHTLALYIDRDYSNRSYHLILTKVSP